MAYVPSFKYDIFVSYSHVTDEPTIDWTKGWVSSFSDDLRKLLQQKLGPDISIWIDKTNLRRSANYLTTIQDEVRSSALLLTVNSDPYLSSTFCEREVRHFKESWSTATSQEERPILQIFQSVGPSGIVPKIEGNHNGFFFCVEPKSSIESGDPFPPRSPRYKSALKNVAREIQGLLYEMRKKRESIFLGAPKNVHDSDFAQLFENLRKELSQKYRVETPVFKVGKEVLDLLAETKISIHFLSQQWDAESQTQIETALAGKRPCAVFAPVEIVDNPDHPLSRFLKDLEDLSRARSKDEVRVIPVIPGLYTVSAFVEIIDELMPRPKAPKVSAKSLVYVITNPGEADDSDVAKVRKLLEQVGWVRFEPYEIDEGISVYGYHLKQIATCDGVLLVWSEVDTWFDQNYRQLKNGRGFRGGKPFRSEAVCVLPPPPSPPAAEVVETLRHRDLVLQFSKDDDFQVGTLAPFLDRLKPPPAGD